MSSPLSKVLNTKVMCNPSNLESLTRQPLELIHSDICEMKDVLINGEQRYFMTMIDDTSTYCYVYLLKTKDEALNCFKTYKTDVKNQLEKKIIRFRSNHDGEYFSNGFNLFCAEHSVIHERTPPHPPQSNGVTERKNRTLTDCNTPCYESLNYLH
jgi:hypothetical protein